MLSVATRQSSKEFLAEFCRLPMSYGQNLHLQAENEEKNVKKTQNIHRVVTQRHIV